MSKSIQFTKMWDISDAYQPKPASTFLPEWYKKTNGYIGNKKDITPHLETNGTIKKCIPVFDALTSGYIIPTYSDILIKKNEDGSSVYLPSMQDSSIIQFHTTMQAPYHPRMNGFDFPKWLNPWGIKTPPGYSCLFMPPVHGGNEYFTILEGVVDTDRYVSCINFPFVLNDINFEGIIPAGTPMVQVIPFKRDSWTHSFGDEKDIKEVNSLNKKLISRFYDRYKTFFWNKKEFR